MCTSKSRAQIVASTPSSSPPASARSGDRRLSHAEQLGDAPHRRLRLGENAPHGLRPRARGQRRCNSPGGPGRITTAEASGVEHEARRGAGEAEHERTARHSGPASARRARSRRADGRLPGDRA